VILVDTSVLVEALTGPRDSLPALVTSVERGERLRLSALVLYEYLRGPRSAAEIAHQDALLPADGALPFGAAEAAMAARLFRVVPRARRRELDLAIAATALTHEAALWTLNAADFRDIPGLRLYVPPV
jgi:predicted nucleic acid-binding protein